MSGERGPAEQLDDSWNDNAHAWALTVRERLIESRRVATDAAIIEAVLAANPRRVLDVGCGEGWLCRVLASEGIACIGVDGSAELIAAARAADDRGEYHELRYAEFGRLTDLVGASSCDTAVCNFSLLHEEIGPILDAVRSTIRPGGALVIQTVHPWTAGEGGGYADGWRTESFSWSTHRFPEPMSWYFRTLESWVDAVRGAGYAIDRIAETKHPDTGRQLSLMLFAIPT